MTDFAKSAPGKIEMVQHDNLYTGFYKLDHLQLRHEKFDGSMSRVINREVFVPCVYCPTTRSAMKWC